MILDSIEESKRLKKLSEKIKEPYRLNKRRFEEIYKYGGNFYKSLREDFGSFVNSVNDEAYKGYEHNPKDLSKKLPNITFLYNLPLQKGGFVYGSSLGHVHPVKDFSVQEIYEFLNDGGLLLGFKDKVELHVCKPKEKVVVPSNCIMTIFNFDRRNLVTLDMANPRDNPSSKDILVENEGPMMVFFRNKENKTYGVRFNSNYDVFNLSKDDYYYFVSKNKEGSLVDALLDNKHILKSRYNLDVIQAEKRIRCLRKDGSLVLLKRSMAQKSLYRLKPFHKVFGLSKND